MDRETIASILGRAPAFARKGSGFRTADGHQVSVYLGEPGNAMVIAGVREIVLEKEHIEINAKGNSTFYVAYQAVHAVLDRIEEGARAAGAGVGFD